MKQCNLNDKSHPFLCTMDPLVKAMMTSLIRSIAWPLELYPSHVCFILQHPTPRRCATYWTRKCSLHATSTSAPPSSISSAVRTPASVARPACALCWLTMRATAESSPSWLSLDHTCQIVVSVLVSMVFPSTILCKCIADWYNRTEHPFNRVRLLMRRMSR